ncbi:LysR family transcriptional regulator [Ramlibacter sp. AN1015]|uniref:LysR family transcriptional regulator n=1 Tax=Ramlibacter sp. AN1015 TaxID=3133428 RepID=UPI0030BCC10F
MELRQLRHFVCLAQVLNFSRAAEQLYIAQPALSISIRNLEEELGLQLFDRGPRHVVLTQAGRVTLSSARAALAHIDDVGNASKALGRGEAGLLKIGFVGGATFRILPRVIPEFRRRYPGVELELTEATTLEVLRRVRSGEVDGGILRHPVLGRAEQLLTAVLELDPLVAVVPRGHHLQRRGSLRLKQLATESFVQYSHIHAPSMSALVSLACESAGFSPRVSQEAVQIQTIVSLVESGLGVALVPESCSELIGRGATFIPIRDHREQLTVGLAFVRSGHSSNKLVQNFLDVIAGTVAAESPRPVS